jgi:hypothetical protein
MCEGGRAFRSLSNVFLEADTWQGLSHSGQGASSGFLLAHHSTTATSHFELYEASNSSLNFIGSSFSGDGGISGRPSYSRRGCRTSQDISSSHPFTAVPRWSLDPVRLEPKPTSSRIISLFVALYPLHPRSTTIYPR